MCRFTSRQLTSVATITIPVTAMVRTFDGFMPELRSRGLRGACSDVQGRRDLTHSDLHRQLVEQAGTTKALALSDMPQFKQELAMAREYEELAPVGAMGLARQLRDRLTRAPLAHVNRAY